MLFILIASAVAGYLAAPAVPYLFVYLPRGGFVGAYPTADECIAARRAFSAGRGIGSEAAVVIGQRYINTCEYSAHVSIDMGPATDRQWK